ncbi:YjcZ family sporulation protein [Haloplasma contractile]
MCSQYKRGDKMAGYDSGYALILVLFILLVIIGCACLS